MKNNYSRLKWVALIVLAGTLLFLAKTATAANPAYPSFQQQEVSGKVHDQNGMPIPGVTIAVVNTTRGSVTNLDGEYTITAPADDTLVFSYIGYKTYEVEVNGRKEINIQMVEDIAALGEVQINAGYYNTTERESTGNISRVTAEEIQRQPVTNPLAALQGRMPGVNITQTTGVPGGGFEIQIRGQNSLRDDGNEPLYIVDGVPFSSGSLGNTRNSASIIPNGAISPLNLINAADIKSIEVLKDADATSIYGSRGANGVVLITTKKGDSQDLDIDLNAYTGVGKITRTIDLMNTDQYLEMRREAFENDGLTEYPANAYDVNGTWDQDRYTDWQKEFLGGKAKFRDVRLAVSGGSKQTKFLFSGNYRNETTVYPGDFDYDKAAVLLNLNHQSNDARFNFNTSVNYVVDNNNLPATDLTREALRLPPNAPEVYHENGSLNWASSTWNNPLRYFNTKYRSFSNNLIANTTVEYKITKDFGAKLNLGYTHLSTEEDRTTPNTFYNPAFGLGSEFSFLTVSDGKRESWILEPQLNWSKILGRSQFDILVGATIQNNKSSYLLQFAEGFRNNRLIYNLAAANNVNIEVDEEEEYRYNAIFGRINYKLKNRYFFNITGRRDGSSRFGSGKKLANFWSIGTAWLFSEEPFSEEFSLLSFGKLRGSYGITGNDQIGNYQYLNTYTISSTEYDGETTLTPSRLFNPDFGWEENRKLEMAIDLGFFHDNLFLSASYYRNKSSNQLVGVPLPGTTGFSNIQANLNATVKNWGWELEARFIPFSKEYFKWSVNGNLTLPRNELISFPNLQSSTYVNQYVVGEPITISKFFDYAGIDPESGLYTFRDFNNDGSIASPMDNQFIADATPTFYGGLSNHFTYKNWDLNFLFQFAKQKGFNYLFFSGLPGAMANKPTAVLDRWQNPGDEALVQRYSAGYNREASLANQRFISSSEAFTDASYLRLKNLSIGYTIPNSAIGFGKLRLYFQAQNLLTITQYEGMDPETRNMQNLPPLKILTGGINLNF